MIAAKFPTLDVDDDVLASQLTELGLDRQLFELAAEAVCEAVHREDPNLDIADLVLSIRNNAAFRAITETGVEFGLFQQRSRGGKSFITNLDGTLKLMVHNTDAATALGAHIPTFLSKRRRNGTAYVHSEAQGELDFGEVVIEPEEFSGTSEATTVDVCIFAEKNDGGIDCRIELLVDARLTERGDAFETCSKRLGLKFKPDEFGKTVAEEDFDEQDDFSDVVKPKNAR
ncbi:hypothetical protein [Actibacterium sp.]|uniref:hypothetical protein n=1 Tax=Actibacterium sp. TaxID=1872125 RepID=UPI00257B7BD0|nr:hypothetical protein [Actibacterium sp.]